MIGSIFDSIFILHLADDKERAENVAKLRQEIDSSNVHVISAVTPNDPEFLSRLDFSSISSFPGCFRCSKKSCSRNDCNNVLIPSQIACYMTHQKGIRKFIQSDQRVGLILEDDVRLKSYLEFLNDSELKKIRELLDVDEPVLLKLSWALDSRHLPVDFVSFDLDESTMANPAYALNRPAAHLLNQAMSDEVSHTADVVIHSKPISNLDRYIMYPPLFDELSWSTGKINSSIHPKENRLDYLSENTLDEDEVARHKTRLEGHVKHVSFTEQKVVKVGSSEELRDALIELFDTNSQQLIFGKKPRFSSILTLDLSDAFTEDSVWLVLSKLLSQALSFYKKTRTDSLFLARHESREGFLKAIDTTLMVVGGKSGNGIDRDCVVYANNSLLASAAKSDAEGTFSSGNINGSILNRSSYENFVLDENFSGVCGAESRVKFTIVVVIYNPDENIYPTLDSIGSQDLELCEVLVVDGSPDRRHAEAIKAYLDQEVKNDALRYVVLRGKDEGIYDAMNKGVKCAQGEWIIFINCGDQFFDESTMSLYKDSISDEVGIVYGDTLAFSKTTTNYIESKPFVDFLPLGNIFSHQSVAVRRELLLRFPFDTRFSIVADHRFFLTCYFHDIRFLRLDACLSRVDDGGVSSDAVARTIQRWESVRDLTKRFGSVRYEDIDQFYRNLLMKDVVPAPIPFYLNEFDHKFLGVVE